jgi:autotransporter-associated beta strand protein/T5SS/PEP-CTERM-associated repeat protein
VSVTGGAIMSNVAGNIAYGSGSTGVLTVSGAGSTWTSTGAVSVAYAGSSTGTVNLNSSGTAVASAVTVGAGASSVGTLNFNGGTLKASAASTTWLTAGSGAAYVYVQGGGATFDTNGYNDTIGLPLLAGNITSGGGLTKSGGTGTLTLSGLNTYTGPTTVSAGTLSLAQACLNDTARVNIASSAVLSLAFSSPDTIGALFLGGVQQWAGLYNSTTPGGYIAGSGSLNVTVTVLSGDANRDGSVNGTDLNTVLSNYNQTGLTWNAGDFNGDGSVNGTDLNTVLSNYNQSVSVGASVGAAVPEPSTLLLLAAGLVGLLAYAWKKRK